MATHDDTTAPCCHHRSAVILWEIVIALDAARADVWDDANPFHTGIREGLERAATIVRGRLATMIETER